eukprot:756319-Hanusia_phi.AAC.6
MKEITFGDLKNRIDKAWNDLSQEEQNAWKEEQVRPDCDQNQVELETSEIADEHGGGSQNERDEIAGQHAESNMEVEDQANLDRKHERLNECNDDERDETNLEGSEVISAKSVTLYDLLAFSDTYGKENEDDAQIAVKLEVQMESEIAKERLDEKTLFEEQSSAIDAQENGGKGDDLPSSKGSGKKSKASERIIFGSARQMAIAAAKEEMQQETEKKWKESNQVEDNKKKTANPSKGRAENSTKDPARKLETSSTFFPAARVKGLDSHDVDPAWMGFVYDEGLESNLQGPDCFAESTTLQFKSALASEKIEKDESLESSEERKWDAPKAERNAPLRHHQQDFDSRLATNCIKQEAVQGVTCCCAQCVALRFVNLSSTWSTSLYSSSCKPSNPLFSYLARKAGEIVEQFRELVSFMEKNVRSGKHKAK